MSHPTAGSLADGELVTLAAQHHGRRAGANDAEVDVEGRANRCRTQISEELSACCSPVIRVDCLGSRAAAECQPVGARAVIVHVPISRTVELVTRLGRQISYPNVQIDDPQRVVAVTEPDNADAALIVSDDERDIYIRGLECLR